MKRRIILPTLAILIAPLALGVTSANASGGDDDHDESEQENESSDSSVPSSSTPSSSIPVPSAPSIPGVPSTSVPSGSSRFAEMLSKLNGLIERIGRSPLPDNVKQDLRARVEALVAKVTSGQRVESRDLEAIAKAIENAVRPSRPASSAPTSPSAPPSSIGGSLDDDADDDDIGDDDSNDDTDDDADDDDSTVSIPGGSFGDDSSGRPRFDIDKVRRGSGQVRGDLLANIDRATAALNTLAPSEARDAVLASLTALRTRVEAGETIPFDEVRDVFHAVADLVYERIGEGPDDDVAPAPGTAPGELQRQRMLGSVTEALELLSGDTSEAAEAATAALEAVKATLEAGELPSRETFESAMELAREALEANPASKAILTLAGVIAAITASDMPADVKAELLVVLNAAKDRLIDDPTADPGQVVRDALNQVREARIAASVQRMLAIADRLETAATTAGNTDALLMITEARVLLQPSDGSLPDREDLHRARRILVRVAILLRSSTPSSTTVPPTTEAPTSTTEAPSTTVI